MVVFLGEYNQYLKEKDSLKKSVEKRNTIIITVVMVLLGLFFIGFMAYIYWHRNYPSSRPSEGTTPRDQGEFISHGVIDDIKKSNSFPSSFHLVICRHVKSFL